MSSGSSSSVAALYSGGLVCMPTPHVACAHAAVTGTHNACILQLGSRMHITHQGLCVCAMAAWMHITPMHPTQGIVRRLVDTMEAAAAHTHKHTHTHARAHTHARMHARTHARTHTHTHTHTHTRARTHARYIHVLALPRASAHRPWPVVHAQSRSSQMFRPPATRHHRGGGHSGVPRCRRS